MFNIAINSFYFILAIIVMLFTATIVGLLKNKGANKNNELTQRIKSWWWIVVILLIALSLDKKVSMIFFGFLSFLALKEFCSIFPIRQSDRVVLFWAYLSIPIQYYLVYVGWYGMFIIFIPVYMFLFFPIIMVIQGETKGFIRSAGVINWATMLTVYCISHIAYLLTLPVKNISAGSIGLVLFLVFLTQFNDVCQYVWGKTLGKHKIIPKVSPNKTWEGFLGAVVTIATVSGFLAPFLTPISFWHGVLLGLLISVSGFFGDVVISSVKRDLQIKDSGNLIPGHGGILDRLDSIMYTAPLFFHITYYIYY